MKTLAQIIGRLGAYAGAAAIGAAAPLIVTGDPAWWMAALGAVAPSAALILGSILKAYGSDGKLTQEEIDQAFAKVDDSK